MFPLTSVDCLREEGWKRSWRNMVNNVELESFDFYFDVDYQKNFVGLWLCLPLSCMLLLFLFFLFFTLIACYLHNFLIFILFAYFWLTGHILIFFPSFCIIFFVPLKSSLTSPFAFCLFHSLFSFSMPSCTCLPFSLSLSFYLSRFLSPCVYVCASLNRSVFLSHSLSLSHFITLYITFFIFFWYRP